MNTEHNYELIVQFADSHATSQEVAEAIFWLARNEADAQRIWESASNEEVLAIWERATKNGNLDADDLFWGTDSLQKVLDQSV